MIIYYVDTEKDINIEIYDFYNTVLDINLKDGLPRGEASNVAFDAVELRYCIKKSRAVQIIYAMRKAGVQPKKYRQVFMANNIDLIDILKQVNEVYEKGK